MNIILRPYQIDSVSGIRHAYGCGYRAPILVLPTGGGKTVIFVFIAFNAAMKGKRVLILIHRRELLKQASRTLSDFGVEHGLIASGLTFSPFHSVQVASVQTIVRRMEKIRWTPDIIIVDECHHATHKTTWGKVLQHYPRAKILGVTATPERLDGQGLGAESGGFFDTMITGPSVADLTAQGYLSPAVIYAPTTQIDLSGVKTRGGDFAQNELAAVMDRPTITGDAVGTYRKHCHQQPAIAFCASVQHAEHVAAAFSSAGYRAASVDGGMDHATRASRVADLGAGRLDVLTSCDIISEGTDVPVVSAAILLRPTQSLSLCLQQMGRVLRPFPGKTHATILDHVGNVFRHGFPDDDRAWSLEGKQKGKGKKKDDDAPAIRQCEKCYAVHRPAPVCPKCGFAYPKQAREIEQVAGELAEVKRDEIAERRQAKQAQASARSLEELVELGRKRGYRNPHAWASHVWGARAQRGATA